MAQPTKMKSIAWGDGNQLQHIESLWDATLTGNMPTFKPCRFFENFGIQIIWAGLAGNMTVKLQTSINNGANFDDIDDPKATFVTAGAAGSHTFLVAELAVTQLRVVVTVASGAGTLDCWILGGGGLGRDIFGVE